MDTHITTTQREELLSCYHISEGQDMPQITPILMRMDNWHVYIKDGTSHLGSLPIYLILLLSVQKANVSFHYEQHVQSGMTYLFTIWLWQSWQRAKLQLWLSLVALGQTWTTWLSVTLNSFSGLKVVLVLFLLTLLTKVFSHTLAFFRIKHSNSSLRVLWLVVCIILGLKINPVLMVASFGRHFPWRCPGSFPGISSGRCGWYSAKRWSCTSNRWFTRN
jgi:hypothetical protein